MGNSIKYLKFFVYAMGVTMMLGVVIISYSILKLNQNYQPSVCEVTNFLKDFDNYEIIGLENNQIHVMVPGKIITYSMCDGAVIREINLR